MTKLSIQGKPLEIYIAFIRHFILFCLILINSLAVFASAASSDVAVDSSLYQPGMDRALENLINQYNSQKKYKEAIAKLDEEIKKKPDNVPMLYKEAEIYADIEQYYKAKKNLDKIMKLEPNNKEAKKLAIVLDKKIKEIPCNEIGFDQDEAYVSDVNGFWTFSSLHYYRLTQYGTYGGRINYANRYNNNGVQYVIEAFPKFSNFFSTSLSFGYANNAQILYPNLQYRIEPYFDFANGIEISVGQNWQKYIVFSNQKIIANTGTIGKNFKNNFIWYRPSFYSPTSSTFNELGLRHYANKKNTYFTLKLNAGRLPDIGDLPPLDKILVLKQRGINLDGQYAITKNFFLRAEAGFTRQFYLESRHLRKLTDAAFGFVYQF